MNKWILGKPWKEEKPFYQRRGGDGGGRVARPGHRLCYHESSGQDSSLSGSIFSSRSKDIENIKGCLMVDGWSSGEVVKQHGEVGAHAWLGAAWYCP